MTDWTGKYIENFYRVLYDAYGLRHWWPSDSPFETIIGAILAQNVTWTGASTAISALISAGLMDPDKLFNARDEIIATHIYSSRYYNQKTKKIRNFLQFFLTEFDGSVERMKTEPVEKLRIQLLGLKGFGPETVDSILLYALEKPIFVVDAYTRRIGERQGWFDEKASYEMMQNFFMSRLSPDIHLYNDFHAQIVYLGNQVCKKTPRCNVCPVRNNLILPGCTYPGNKI